MACQFVIRKKKFHLAPCTSIGAAREKRTANKKTRAKKGNPIKTSVSGAGVVTFAKHISAAPE